MNKTEIGGRIRAYMKENKITQTEIAEKMKVGQSYVSAMMNGDRDTLRLAEALSEHYGVSLDWLISGISVDNQEEKCDNIPSGKLKYYERAVELFMRYMENEQRYQDIIKENQELLKQMSAVQKLMSEV